MNPSPLQGEHTRCDRLCEGMVETTDERRWKKDKISKTLFNRRGAKDAEKTLNYFQEGVLCNLGGVALRVLR